jgi:hypothetical protein
MGHGVRIRWLLPAVFLLASCGFGPDKDRCENHSCPAPALPQVTATLRLDGQVAHTSGRPVPLAGGRSHAASLLISVPPDAKVSSYALGDAGGSYGPGGSGQHLLRQGKSLVNGQVLELDWGPLSSGPHSLVLNYSEDGMQIASSVGDFIVS